MVCALGCEEQLVGRSHECDFPASVARLPVCTAPTFRSDAASPEIDRQVKALLERGLSVYRVDAELLGQLRPDLIITQTQCEVCAVSRREVEEAVCAWLGSRPRIVSLEPKALEDLWRNLHEVAAALGVPGRGAQLVRRLQARVEAIAEAARRLPERPTVACLEWIEPLMAAGNWMPELVELAGGRNLFGVAGAHSPWMTWEDLRAKDPELIVALPCGFDLARTTREMALLTRRAGWQELAAVRRGQVYVADGNQYFNRPGPRLVESLEILAELLHPEAFHFSHEGSGWRRLSSG